MSRPLFKSRRGATAIEYGLIAALIAIAIIVAVGTVGASLGVTFCPITDYVTYGGDKDDAWIDAVLKSTADVYIPEHCLPPKDDEAEGGTDFWD